MEENIKAMLELSQKMSKVCMTDDGIVTAHPCYLFDAHLASTDGGETLNDLYHSTSADGSHLVGLNTKSATSFNYAWWPPLWCPDGLYVVVGENLDCLSFHFLMAQR